MCASNHRAQATLQKHQVELDALQIQGRAVKIEKQKKVVEQVRRRLTGVSVPHPAPTPV